MEDCSGLKMMTSCLLFSFLFVSIKQNLVVPNKTTFDLLLDIKVSLSGICSQDKCSNGNSRENLDISEEKRRETHTYKDAHIYMRSEKAMVSVRAQVKATKKIKN